MVYSEDYGDFHVLRQGVELYLTTDIESLSAFIDGEDHLPEDAYPPVSAISYVECARVGLRDIEYYDEVLKTTYSVQPKEHPEKFCWSQQVVSLLEDVEDITTDISVFDEEERKKANVTTYEVPSGVGFDDTVTVTIEFEESDNVDNEQLVVRLAYGGPWDDINSQQITTEVRSKGTPEDFIEVVGLVELAFEKDPVRDISLCCLNDADDES